MNWLYEIEDKVMAMFMACFLWSLTIHTEEIGCTYVVASDVYNSLSIEEHQDYLIRRRQLNYIKDKLKSKVYETTNTSHSEY